MGLRYVWEKWDIKKTAKYYLTNYMYIPIAQNSINLFYGDNYSVDEASETFTIENADKVSISNGNSFTLASDKWFILHIHSTASSTYLRKTITNTIFSVTSHSSGGSFPYVAESDEQCESYNGLESEKGSTSYGNISSASSGAYPSNNYSGSYWYVKKGSDTIDPASVNYPASPNGGELIDITIAPSTGNTFGGTVKYKVEYQLDGGNWQTAVEATTTTTVSVLIPKGTNTFTARATASDNMGFTSTTAVTGATVNVVNNAAPVISCETSSLGEIAEPFSVSYSVSDEDADTMTITEKIDGTVIRSYSAPSGSSGEQTFNPSALQWLTTLNGSHTATITADDGKGGVTTHSISFTRAVHTMTVTLEEPMETDAAITKCVVNIARNLPADAEWSLLVTNNAFDPEPVWEDITQYVKNGWNWVFENQTVTSGRYGFNFMLTCSRGASGQGGSVDTISGGFE